MSRASSAPALARPVRLLALVALLAFAPALAGCTGAPAPPPDDPDGDGFPDAQELQERSISVDTAGGTLTRKVTSDPALADTDADGLRDAQEFLRGTDPRSPDTDGDGLLDGETRAVEPGSELHAALEAAGVIENPEREGEFLGELSYCKENDNLRPARWDSDYPVNDTVGDGDELRGWDVRLPSRTYHVTSNPCVPHSDTDGVNDGTELQWGTDPMKSDTDGDGVMDTTDPDPLADLWLQVTLEEITLKRDMLVPGADQDVTFTLAAGADSRQIRFTAPGKGTHVVNETWVTNFPDSSGPSRDRFPVEVILQAVVDGPNGEEGLAISGASPTNRVVPTWDLLQNRWTLGIAKGEASITTEGSDAILKFRIETLRR